MTPEERIADLERRLAETTAALEAARETGRKLTDPLFRFDGALSVQDTHGITAFMAQGFLDLLNAYKALNFQSFIFERGGVPAVIVTIRRATGKTPEERYNEVACELAALKGTDVVPLPPQDPEVPAEDTHHCRLDDATGRMWCSLCGDEEALPQPVRGDVLIAALRSFEARHAGCPARRAAAVSIDVLGDK